MVWAILLWFLGMVGGAGVAWAIPYWWVKQDPRRLGDVVKYIIDQFAASPGSTRFVKMYAALFDTNRATKAFVYASPTDVSEGIRWYIRSCFENPQFRLVSNPGFADGTGESQENASGTAQALRDLSRSPDAGIRDSGHAERGTGSQTDPRKETRRPGSD